MTSYVIFAHGGSWKDNLYEGGIKDYIPILDSGLHFDELLSKIEVRLKKDRSIYLFDIVALVQIGQDGEVRMKIIENFEWCSLVEMTESVTLYVSVCCKSKTPLLNTITDEDGMSVQRLETSCGSISTQNGGSSQWIIPGVSSHSSKPIEEILVQPEDVAIGDLAVGSKFDKKDMMISVVSGYHMKNLLECKTKWSDTNRYHIVCKIDETCCFSMRARSFGHVWRIYEWIAHTCKRDVRRVSKCKVFSKAVADLFVGNLMEDGSVCRPRDIQGQVLREFGINLKYSTALAGRNRALKMNYGDPDQSFQIVAKYLHVLQECNPGSIVDLKTCDDLSFMYCYFALGACVRAFHACRPVVVVDATHLNGKYKGVLFVASTKDANEQIFPLAFGVGDKENNASWTWFFSNLRRTFGIRNNLIIVSDQHLSIKNVVHSVFPGIPHGLCTYHIQDVANAYKEEDFNLHMEDLMSTAPGAHAKLMRIDPTRLARCKCPVRRYAFGKSNAVEVLNSRLKWARKLPICALLEYALNMVQAWFFERRTKANERIEELSEYGDKRLGFAIRKGKFLKIEPINNLKFNVISGTKSNIVDISSRACSCQVFQTDLFPCSLAAKVIGHMNENPNAYVNHYYTTQSCREIYALDVMPVRDHADWCVPEGVASVYVKMPSNQRQAGRPRSNRIQAGDRGRGILVCTRCHERGHYESKCTAFKEVHLDGEACSSQATTKHPRKARSCGICGVVGHTRKNCNDPNQF